MFTDDVVFTMVANGSMSLEEFLDWVSEQRSEAYTEGSNNANYYNAVVGD